MNDKFEQLLELLYPAVKELLNELENGQNSNNILDFQAFPSIYQSGGQNDKSA